VADSDDSDDKVDLTPQLQLAIRMLQGNHRELREWIQEALRDNPALSWAPPKESAEVDAEIRVGADGELSVVLADDGVLGVAEDAEGDPERRAQWLVSALARRRRAIERLLETIVPHQRGFLRGEDPRPAELSPQVLAAQLGFHRSTVDRLLKGKSLRIHRSVEGDEGAQTVALSLEELAVGGV